MLDLPEKGRRPLGLLFAETGARHSAGQRNCDLYVGDRSIEFHSCKVCACSTHWSPVDKTFDRMRVNARMMAPEVLAAARVHKSAGP